MIISTQGLEQLQGRGVELLQESEETQANKNKFHTVVAYYVSP
jgi:hypothetical protein